MNDNPHRPKLKEAEHRLKIAEVKRDLRELSLRLGNDPSQSGITERDYLHQLDRVWVLTPEVERLRADVKRWDKTHRKQRLINFARRWFTKAKQKIAHHGTSSRTKA